jgi:kynureninase
MASAGDAQSKHVYSREYAVSLDAQDALCHMNREFFIPSKAELKAKALPEAGRISPSFWRIENKVPS